MKHKIALMRTWHTPEDCDIKGVHAAAVYTAFVLHTATVILMIHQHSNLLVRHDTISAYLKSFEEAYARDTARLQERWETATSKRSDITAQISRRLLNNGDLDHLIEEERSLQREIQKIEDDFMKLKATTYAEIVGMRAELEQIELQLQWGHWQRTRSTTGYLQ